MRRLLLRFAALTAAVTSPTLAAGAPSDDEVAEALPQRSEIEAAAGALDRMIDVLLDTRVGPLADAIDPERRADPRHRDETLRDMVRRDDPYFEERVHGSIDAMTEGASEIMARLAALAPVLRETLDDIERRADEAARD